MESEGDILDSARQGPVRHSPDIFVCLVFRACRLFVSFQFYLFAGLLDVHVLQRISFVVILSLGRVRHFGIMFSERSMPLEALSRWGPDGSLLALGRPTDKIYKLRQSKNSLG